MQHTNKNKKVHMTKLLGITGLAQAGKDTFADICVKLGYTRLAFADAVKTTTAFVANEPTHLYFANVTKEEHTDALGMTRRRAMQNVGNGMREIIGPRVWVNRTFREWESNGRQPTVISDIRYDNEAEEVRNHGGFNVRIIRSGSGLEGEAAKHISEAGVRNHLIDFEIFNNGSISELQAEVKKILLIVDGRGDQS
jgi:hypothetical protein